MNNICNGALQLPVKLCVLAIAAFFSLSARAELLEGRDYAVLNPTQPVDDANKIEVKEFFSYACHSCNEFYPHFAKWETKCPNDVAVVRVPLSLGHPQWEPLIRTYYALDAGGDVKRLDKQLFYAIHDQHESLFSDAAIVNWSAQRGIDRSKIAGLMGSFSVAAKAREAELQARRFKVGETPAIVVNGKYRLLASAAKSYAEWPGLIDQLIAKVRAEKR